MAGLLNGALPSFDMDGGAVLLALVRGVAVACLLSVFGTMAFRSLVAPRAFARLGEAERIDLDRRIRRWAWWGLGAAAASLLLWLPLQSSAIAGASSLVAAGRAVPTVVADTSFGHILLLQMAGVAATALALRVSPGRCWVATLLAGVALALQSGHSHSAAMYAPPSFLLGSELLHLLAGGAWLGGLWPLLLVVRHGPPRAGAMACRYFSPLGKYCVVAVLATAAWQFWELIGGFPGLVGTAYGWVAVGKMVLFAVLFAFALVNRYTLGPLLLGAEPEGARRALVRSIAVQSLAGLAVVLAAGLLSQLSPAIHSEPVWPFSVEPSLVTVREDAEFRDEVLRAVFALMGAVAIFGLAIAWRARRWFPPLAGVVAAALVVRAVPHLDLLFVPATPTSYYRSPTSFGAASILAGGALYPSHCASCHGADGHGDGPQAKGLPIPPADLTAPHLWDHADGELFGWIAHGMAAPAGGLAMPGFSNVLNDDDVWALIDYIRAHNAGVAYAASRAWPLPVQAPSFQLRCGAADETDLAALRGRVVRLAFGGATPGAEDGAITVLAAGEETAARQGGCVADDAALRDAYAVVTGLPAARLDGAEVLIDANGWLREVRPPGAASDAAAVKAIVATPLQAAAGGMSHHHE
jgi:putative copper export protein/mono/diheme cytochrome c family protein